MSITSLILSSVIFFTIFYLYALKKDDFSVVDIAWGPSFFLVFLVGAYQSQWDLSIHAMIVGALCGIWAIRLALYIAMRSIKLGKEDFRYTEFRKSWGNSPAFHAFYRVFMLQSLLSMIIASPLFLIHFSRRPEFGSWNDILGVAIAIFGIAFQALADHQKNVFKSDPLNKGKVLTKGLWKYSRHPNYFGEAALWWGVFLISISVMPWWHAVIGPFLINFFLLKVSGVSMLERKYEGRSDYSAYKNTTNAFIPWFPRGKA